MARVQADPLVSGAQPFLIMARGLARYENGQMVWDATFDTTNGKVIINGTTAARVDDVVSARLFTQFCQDLHRRGWSVEVLRSR